MMKAGQGRGSLLITAPGGEDSSGAPVQALFKEARRRRRLRRLACAAISVLLVTATAFGLTAGWPHRHVVPAPRGHTPLAVTGGPGFTLPAAAVAWVDYSGQLHVGQLATRAQRVVATVPALAGTSWLLQVGGRLYAGGAAVIRQFNIATGAVRLVARGEGIFASADRQRLYVPQGSATLLELPAGESGKPRRLTLPAGWTVDRSDQAVAGGVVVDSHLDGARGRPPSLAIWNPGTGIVKIIGRGAPVVMGAYTAPGAGYSLLAWQAAGCLSGNCPIQITNTVAMTTVSVRSPLHHGFTSSGAAFSPDGTRLAVFARTANLDPLRVSRSYLGLASTRTGGVRLVPGAGLSTTEDAGWVLWLPGGNRLLAGALDYSYAVDTATYTARPFFFFPGNSDHDIMDTPDINFSSTLLLSHSTSQDQRLIWPRSSDIRVITASGSAAA